MPQRSSAYLHVSDASMRPKRFRFGEAFETAIQLAENRRVASMRPKRFRFGEILDGVQIDAAEMLQ